MEVKNKSIAKETILGSITIVGIQVYIILHQDTAVYTYITNNLVQRIPIGIIVYVPTYKEPFIYFDEMDGPSVFPYFGKNMYYYSLNWQLHF